MKANKIVFSTIAALALSTSAFGAGLVLDPAQPNKTWDTQLGSGSESLVNLGWGSGVTSKISTIIGGASATGGTTIVGSLSDIVGASTKIKNTYVKAENNGLKTSVNTLTTTASPAVADVSVADLFGDYEKVKAQLNLAKAAKIIYNNNNNANLSSDIANAGKAITLKSGLSEATLRDIAYALKAADDSIDLNDYKKDGKYDQSATGFDNSTIQGLFNTGILQRYVNKDNLDKLNDDIAILNTMLGDITKDLGTLINSLSDADAKAKANYIKIQLDNALETYAKYKEYDLQISEQEALIGAAVAKINGKYAKTNSGFNSIDIYEDIAQDAQSKPLTTKEAIKENITSKFNTQQSADTKFTGGTADDAYAGAIGDWTNTIATQGRKLTLSQFIEFVKAKITKDSTGTTYAKANSTKFTNDGGLRKFAEEIEAAINENRAIDKTKAGVDNIGDALDELLGGASDSYFYNSSYSAAAGTALAFTKNEILAYNAAMDATDALTTDELNAVINAQNDLQALKSKFNASSAAAIKADSEINKTLGSISSVLSAEAKAELKNLLVDDNGAKITTAAIDGRTEKEFGVTESAGNNDITPDAKMYEKYGVDASASGAKNELLLAILKQEKLSEIDDALSGITDAATAANQTNKNKIVAALKTKRVNQHNAAIQKAANNVATAVAESKKDSLAVEGLSTLNIQLNNMNKRLGEIRGLDGEIGVWLRTWGGKMSADNDSFKYYSTQLGADKKTSMKDGDLYLGVLVGYDNVKSDIKSNAYSVGTYASYIDNSGFFADGVMKFVSTKNERSGFDLSNQQTLLASIEGGYRFDLSDGFYVEPSLEFVTGHVGEYKSKEQGSKTELKVDSFTPVVFKPQVFVGGSADAFTYRAGIGGVLSMQGQDASVTIANLAQNLNDAQVDGSSTVKLSKNNHGFASIGGSFKASENFRINLGVERSFGGDLTNDYEVNMTLRYGF